MDRRHFHISSFVAVAAPWAGLTPVQAQGGPVEGKDFLRLGQPLAVAAGPKVEVVEFFGYWCPHCNVFEPMLEAWVRKLPPEVSFRRIPVQFNPTHEIYQRLYFAIEALNLIEALHRKVFAAIHQDRKRLDKEADIQALLAASGVDAPKVLETMKSFSVLSKVRQAKQLTEAYKVDGVPMIGVHGRFTTSLGMAGGPERVLQVTEQLIQLTRKS